MPLVLQDLSLRGWRLPLPSRPSSWGHHFPCTALLRWSRENLLSRPPGPCVGKIHRSSVGVNSPSLSSADSLALTGWMVNLRSSHRSGFGNRHLSQSALDVGNVLYSPEIPAGSPSIPARRELRDLSQGAHLLVHVISHAQFAPTLVPSVIRPT